MFSSLSVSSGRIFEKQNCFHSYLFIYLLHLPKIVEGRYNHCNFVCQWTKFWPNGCTKLDTVFWVTKIVQNLQNGPYLGCYFIQLLHAWYQGTNKKSAFNDQGDGDLELWTKVRSQVKVKFSKNLTFDLCNIEPGDMWGGGENLNLKKNEKEWKM